MAKNRRYNQGFTMAEALITLMVVSMFVLLPSLSLSGWQKTMEEELFISSFEKNIAAAQQAAIARQRITRINFLKETIAFMNTKYASNETVALSIPEGVTCESPGTITFKSTSGNYSELRSVTINVPRRRMSIKYQFMLGSGKYTKTVAK